MQFEILLELILSLFLQFLEGLAISVSFSVSSCGRICSLVVYADVINKFNTIADL